MTVDAASAGVNESGSREALCVSNEKATAVTAWYFVFHGSFSYGFSLCLRRRHLLKLSKADLIGGTPEASGLLLSQLSVLEVVEVRCSLLLVWCRL